MKPIVFCNRSLKLQSKSAFHGDLYVNGNLSTVHPFEPEIFGDVFVEGVFSGDDIIIHGNLVCTDVRCNNLTVDGNILVSDFANIHEEMKSNYGNICILGAAAIYKLTACEGSIYIGKEASVEDFKAFDSIYVGGNMNEVSQLIAGDGIVVGKDISIAKIFTNSKKFPNIDILSGGIHSENININ